MTSIVSYNVNGIRAAIRKGFLEWLDTEQPDVLCLQETKIDASLTQAIAQQITGYHCYWVCAEKKGYSGVAILSKVQPKHVEYGCGIEKYDREGRFIRADFDDFSVLSVYFPSGSRGTERQLFKDQFIIDFQAYIDEVKQTVPKLIISGDINIVHKPIDIHDPVRNKNTSGFLVHEREWITQFLDSGFKDSFRLHNQEAEQYSWWSYRANSRARNKGWRIDYHFIANALESECIGASILNDIVHSDHCPIKVVFT